MVNTCKGDRLLADQFLEKEDFLLSYNGRYTLTLAGNGVLELWDREKGFSVWHTDTRDIDIERAYLHSNGDFVMYAPGGEVVRRTRGLNKLGLWDPILHLSDEGKLMIIATKVFWTQRDEFRH